MKRFKVVPKQKGKRWKLKAKRLEIFINWIMNKYFKGELQVEKKQNEKTISA